MSTSSYRAKHGYVLTKSYTGQQGSALSGLVTLQCWMEKLIGPVYVVEPFIDGSFTHGLPHNNTLRFSDFFDIDVYNKVSVEDGYAELASWEDFLQNAPRSVVLVETHIHHQKPRTKVRWNSHDCNHQLDTLSEHGFCVVRVVDAYLQSDVSTYKQIISGDKMDRVVLGDWKPNNVTVIFNNWSWHWIVGNNASICRIAQEVGLWDKLYPSQVLLRSAKDFEDQIFTSQSHPFHVAIMLRIERVVLNQKKKTVSATEDCMKKIVRLIRRLQKGRDPEQLYVTSDIAKYGSRTIGITDEIRTQLLDIIQDALRPVSNGSMALDFDTTMITHASDRGYMASLQRTIASRADCLVLVGGGNFLKLALGDYLNFHPNPSFWCIHTVCMEKPTARGEEFQKMFNQIMDVARNASQNT